MSRRNLWAAWAVVIGAAFAIVAIAHGHAMWYIIVAIIAGAGYTVITRLTRPAVEAESRDRL